MSTTACAHPNIALIKYWGKSPRAGNYPATPSLSITLDSLVTTTEIQTIEGGDRVFFDNTEVHDRKVLGCLAELRREYHIPFLEVRTRNNFPTAAGLASSASGFAALITAVAAHCKLGLDRAGLSALARRASGSAARSLFGGFVALQGPEWVGRPVLEPGAWPLTTVIAVTTSDPKGVSSSDGMRRSETTSPYYSAWVASTCADFDAALALVAGRDFQGLGELAEFSCLKMHGLMLSSKPGLLYWNPATVACLQAVRELRHQGVPVFFTVDAGPQVKAVCLPEAAGQVREALQSIPGVERILTTGLGQGARVMDP